MITDLNRWGEYLKIILKELCDLLNREKEAIFERDWAFVNKCHTEKQELFDLYKVQVKNLEAMFSLVASDLKDWPLKNEIKVLANDVSDMMERNQSLLLQLYHVAKDVLQSVDEWVKLQEREETLYGDDGAPYDMAMRYSLGLSRRV